jgi:hypothetical protein
MAEGRARASERASRIRDFRIDLSPLSPATVHATERFTGFVSTRTPLNSASKPGARLEGYSQCVVTTDW